MKLKFDVRLWTDYCAGQANETVTDANHSLIELTSTAAAAAGDDGGWQRRMRELQGAIILASLVEVVLGASGVVGVLMRYIGPLTIAPVITMIALPMVNVAASYSQHNWWIAFLCVIYSCFCLVQCHR